MPYTVINLALYTPGEIALLLCPNYNTTKHLVCQ